MKQAHAEEPFEAGLKTALELIKRGIASGLTAEEAIQALERAVYRSKEAA